MVKNSPECKILANKALMVVGQLDPGLKTFD